MGAWLLLLASPLVFSGCTAGTVGVVVYFLFDDDDDGRRRGPNQVQGPVTVVFQGIQNNRTNPGETMVSFRLVSEGSGLTDVRVEFSASFGPFEPVVFQDPVPGSPTIPEAEPGILTGLMTNPAGVTHQFIWNAADQLGGTQLIGIVLRFSAANILDVPVLIGNDAPNIESLRFVDQGDGVITIEIVLSDSSSDPASLALGVSTDLNADEEKDFGPMNLLEGLESLPTSASGATTTVTWLAREDLGPLDRDVLVRVAPRDLIGEVTEGIGDPRFEPAFLDLNSAPTVSSVLISRGAKNGDRRRGLGITFDVADAEGDDVDVVVQWAAEGKEFAELPAEIDTDPAARERLLFSPQALLDRYSLGIVTLRPQRVDGFVVAPAAGVTLEPDEILTTWQLAEGELRGGFDALSGRAVSLFRGPTGDGAAASGPEARGGDGGTDTRVVCDFAPDTGILKLNASFDPIEEPGQRLVIDTAGPIHLSAELAGTRHHVIWASDKDIPGGGEIRVRVTPFDRSFASPVDPLASCRLDPPYPLEGAYPGSRGASGETGDARDLHGPFGGRGAWTVPLASVDDPAALATADIDGDGSMDIVAVSKESRSLVVLLQTAPGRFDQLRFLDERIGDPSDVLIADFDGDGDLDIAVASSSFTIDPDPDRAVPALVRPGSVMLYFQQGSLANGDLDFIAGRISLQGNGALQFPSAIGAGDFDGDGDLDIAVAEAGVDSSSLTIFYRGGEVDRLDSCVSTDPGYASCSFVNDAGGVPEGPRGEIADAYRDLEIIDFDGDGDLDIIYAAEDSIDFVLNDGSGDFTEVFTVDVPGADIRSIALVDIDGDGATDLLAADPTAGEVIVLRRTGVREFELDEPLTTSRMLRPVSLEVADVDGNGSADVLVADEGDPEAAISGHVAVCLADGAGGITCASLERLGENAPRDLAAADFDGDGLTDIASIEAGPREVAVYLQEAPGAFSEPGESLGPLPRSSSPTAVTAGDLDNNGYLDLVVASVTADSLSVLLQSEDGDFTDQGDSAPTGGGFSEVVLGDVDGDGLRDMVTTSANGDRISVWRQSADGKVVGGKVAEASQILASDDLTGPQSIALGDIDGDGRLDLVSVGRFSANVIWFPGGEEGVFGDALLVDVKSVGDTSLSSPAAVAVSDIDRDGRLDLVIAAHRSDEIWILTQGDDVGVFRSEIVELPDGTLPIALELVDLFGDGLTEIAVAGLGERSLFVIREIHSVYQPVDLSSNVSGHGLSSISSADVDADGRLDLVVASPSSGTIEVLRATGADDFAPARVLGVGDLADGSAGFVPVAVLALDLDGDGETDILAVNRAADDVTVFWGGR